MYGDDMSLDDIIRTLSDPYNSLERWELQALLLRVCFLMKEKE